MCDIFPQGKQSRDSFSQSIPHSSKCFELIHIDIWVPSFVPSKNGLRFFLTIVNDYSRCTWVYLMKNKSQNFQMITHFLIKLIDNSNYQFPKFIQEMGVFLSHNFKLLDLTMELNSSLQPFKIGFILME